MNTVEQQLKRALSAIENAAAAVRRAKHGSPDDANIRRALSELDDAESHVRRALKELPS